MGSTLTEKMNLENNIRNGRKHMKLIMSSTNGFLEQPTLSNEQLADRNRQLMSIFPDKCKALLDRLFKLNVSADQSKACSNLFYLLSFDAPLRTVFPEKIMDDFRKMLQRIDSGEIDPCRDFLSICEKVNPRLGNFVRAFDYGDAFDNDALEFLRYIDEQIRTTHGHDVLPAEPGRVRDYNPPQTGHAYYFTASGNQIRFPRLFSVDNVANRIKNHDDESTTSKCSKKYPSVALKSTTYMFLWFCPQHGHCYGFHIIDGSEGRKDPANSLISYLKVAPQVIFYDFACSLEEYCFNRESGYFGNTKFYHDIFHGLSHSCSRAYNSKVLSGVRGVNTSICEQFNSYLQCIKASAKHMSQVNVMFFAQYTIHIWNKSKKKSFEKKLLFATATI